MGHKRVEHYRDGVLISTETIATSPEQDNCDELGRRAERALAELAAMRDTAGVSAHIGTLASAMVTLLRLHLGRFESAD